MKSVVILEFFSYFKIVLVKFLISSQFHDQVLVLIGFGTASGTSE